VLGIKDDAIALDFDLTAAITLQKRKVEEQKAFAALLAANLATMLAGGQFEEAIQRMPQA
jgi:hypothetical protein